MRRIFIIMWLLIGSAAWGGVPTLMERAEKVAAELAWYNVGDAIYDRVPHWGPEPGKVFDAVGSVGD